VSRNRRQEGRERTSKNRRLYVSAYSLHQLHQRLGAANMPNV